MENLTNETIASSSLLHVGIGITYICAGVVFIFLHIVCSYLIYTDKEMQNPTYQFMINLSIADCLELVPLAIYAGASILIGEQNEILGVLMGWLVLLAWYASCVLFAFIAFSRWIALTKIHLVKYVFNKRILICLHVIPWILIGVFYVGTTIAVYPIKTFYFYPSLSTWKFTNSIPLGKYLHWHDFVFNSRCAIAETTFNALSLIWVHQTRKSVQSVAAAKNRKRETKLLIQCTLIGMVFTVTSIAYTVQWVAGLSESALASLIVQIIWTTNHCVNPLVYLGVDKKLRKRFLMLISCKGKKLNQVGISIVVTECHSTSASKTDVIAMTGISLGHAKKIKNVYDCRHG